MPKKSFFILLILILSCFLTTAGCDAPKVEDMNNCEQNPICRLSCSVFYHCDYVESVEQCIEERSDWDHTTSLTPLQECVADYESALDCDKFISCVTNTGSDSDSDSDTDTDTGADADADADADTDTDTDTDTDINTDTDTDTDTN